jgi:hypothetical protein
MITDTDIYFSPERFPGRPHIAIAFGIDGKNVADFVTYIDFFDLLKTSDKVTANNEDCSSISFIKNEEVVETLQTSSFLGSLICSNPDILEIHRPPDHDQAERNRRVTPGWRYDEYGNFFIPYYGWDTEIIDGMSNVEREYRLLEFYTGE